MIVIDPPDVSAMILLDEIEELYKSDQKAFYFKLTGITKGYISRRFSVDALEKTNRENKKWLLKAWFKDTGVFPAPPRHHHGRRRLRHCNYHNRRWHATDQDYGPRRKHHKYRKQEFFLLWPNRRQQLYHSARQYLLRSNDLCVPDDFYKTLK